VIDYQPVDVPLRKPAREASAGEQQAYFEWFLNAVPYRIGELAKLVNATPNFLGWQPDKEPDSLHTLGAWLYTIVKEPDLLKVENELLKKLDTLVYQMPYKSWPLMPVLIHSAAFDTGIYFGEVFRHSFANVEWWLCKAVDEKGRLFIDYGESVLINFDRVNYMNPVDTVKKVVGLSMSKDISIISNSRLPKLSPSKLYELFTLWRNYVPMKDWR
jgi:hypothetical protein